jgi:hypothetical protein
MPRELAELPSGVRLTDFISLGVLAEKFPVSKVHRILRETGHESKRQRNLPAHVVVYYVIALALYTGVSYGEVLRCLVEGLAWLGVEVRRIRKTAKSAISQARSRLGVEPLQRLYEEVVRPIAQKKTQGAWYRGWRLMTLDGSTLELADTQANEAEFGRPGASRGRSGFPQLRFVSLVENGTHVLLGAEAGSYRSGENRLAGAVLRHLKPGMLCLADRNFFSYSLWKKAAGTGADLLWRIKKNMLLPCLKRLPDGSYLSRIYPSDKARRRNRQAILVRVIEYRLQGVEQSEPLYRLITTLTDAQKAPAAELAALYHERWEIENALDELKTHLRGARTVMRSKKPELVLQEFYGFLLAHFAIRGLMHEAALQADIDPDRLSFTHTVRVVRRKLPVFVSIPPSPETSLS